jgi:hypothetical protein
MSFHKNISAIDVHIVYAFTYADSTARLAATGFVTTDVGKVAWQLSDNTFWVLINYSPATWTSLGSSHHGSTHQHNGTDEIATVTSSPNAIPKANSLGTLNSGWLDDSSHGILTGTLLHASATVLSAGFMSAADKLKLDTIAPGAEVNLVNSVFGRTGSVTSQNGDYTAIQVGAEPTGSVASAFTNHISDLNPHSQYLQTISASLLYEVSGTYSSGIASHTASLDPHSQYLQAISASLLYEVSGTYATGINFHISDANPHPQYLQTVSASLLYEVSGTYSSGINSHVSESNPHSQYELLVNKGAANGYASLDSGSLVLSSQIPEITDAQHGNRLGALLHALATTGSAGFMSAADKLKLDTTPQGAELIFRPGAPIGPGVVDTWALVESFANAQETQWSLYIDARFAAAEVSATDDTDLRNICTIKTYPLNGLPLVVKDGGKLRNPRGGLGGGVACEAITTAGIIFDISGAVYDLRDGSYFTNINGVSLVPAIDVTVSSIIIASLSAGAILSGVPGVPMINYTVAGGFYILAQLVNSRGVASVFSDNSLVADATSTLFSIADTTARLGPQSYFSGTIINSQIGTSNNLSWANGDTASRPAYASAGHLYFNTDLETTEQYTSSSTWVPLVRKKSFLVGDGVALTFALTHDLGTREVSVEVFRNSSPWDTVIPAVERNSTTQVTCTFLVAPTTDEYVVIVKG